MVSRNHQRSGRMESRRPPILAASKLDWYRFGFIIVILGVIWIAPFVQAQETSQAGPSRPYASRSAQSSYTQDDPMELRMIITPTSGPYGATATINDYTNAMESYLVKSIKERTDIRITDVQVTVSILSQQVLSGSRRSLQSSLNTLELTDSITIRYLSENNQVYTTSLWIVQAFDTSAEIKAFIQTLKDTNNYAFANVKTVIVTQSDGAVIGSSEQVDSTSGSNDKSAKIGIIVGVICGVFGGVAMAALGVGYFNSRNSQDVIVSKPSAGESTEGETDTAVEKDLERQDDDVNTLVGPVAGEFDQEESTANVTDDLDAEKGLLTPVQDGLDDDDESQDGLNDENQDPVKTLVKLAPLDSPECADDAPLVEQQEEEVDVKATKNEEIRFEVQMPPGKTCTVILSSQKCADVAPLVQQEVRDETTAEDEEEERQLEAVQEASENVEILDSPEGADDSFVVKQDDDAETTEDEKRFEVHVPPGSLGIAIDTPMGGVPEVHSVKPESILADKVQVGDRLVFVDKEDVTNMAAAEVTELISSKSDQDRVLIFARTVVPDNNAVRVRIDSLEIKM